MDITSFNGGNVIKWPQLQPEMSDNQLLGQILMNTTGQLPNKDKNMPLPALLPPLFSRVQFAHNAQYIKALGTHALPREWYLVPGSYHLNWWPANFLNLKGNPSQPTADMQALYRLANEQNPRCVYKVLDENSNVDCGYRNLSPELTGVPTCPAPTPTSMPTAAPTPAPTSGPTPDATVIALAVIVAILAAAVAVLTYLYCQKPTPQPTPPKPENGYGGSGYDNKPVSYGKAES